MQDKAELSGSSGQVIQDVAALLECDPSLLEFALLHFYRQIPGKEPIISDYDKRQALAQRDALARTLYNDMF